MWKGSSKLMENLVMRNFKSEEVFYVIFVALRIQNKIKCKCSHSYFFLIKMPSLVKMSLFQTFFSQRPFHSRSRSNTKGHRLTSSNSLMNR